MTFTPHGEVCVVENALQPQIDFFPMRKQFVQFLLAQHRPQRGLRELRSLVHVIRNLDHRLVRIDHAQKNDGIHFQRDVVAGNDVLRRNFQRLLPQRHAHDAVNRREYQSHARPFRRGQQPSQAKDHAALIFGQNLDGTEKVNDDNDDDDRAKSKTKRFHRRLHPRSAKTLLPRIV